MQPQPDAQTIDMVVAIIAVGALAIGLLSMLVGRVVAWWDRLRGVNTFEEGNADVMSRDADDGPRMEPSAVQTDGRQTDRPSAQPPIPRDIMLNTYKTLRKYGIPREEARGMLRALNLPLDNNLWTQAAPPPAEPSAVTPIAQRPLPEHVKFHDDPELEYEPLR